MDLELKVCLLLLLSSWFTPLFELNIGASYVLAVMFTTTLSFALQGFVAVLIGGVWLSFWVYLVGGRKGVKQTMKACWILWILFIINLTLMEIPFQDWVMIIGIVIIGIWSIIVVSIGISHIEARNKALPPFCSTFYYYVWS